MKNWKSNIQWLMSIPLMLGSWSTAFTSDGNMWGAETPVYEILWELGEPKPKHYIGTPSQQQINMGYDLVFEGRTIGPDGNQSQYISKYFKCTSCHNTIQEDPVINVLDPEARLDYSIENNIPFLQGTTFWGMVNRETWYNDDYYKKYGAWVEEARTSLEASTQLCAEVCSQGRHLEDWEVQALFAYYWSLQLKVEDLDMTTEDWKLVTGNSLSDEEKISMVKSYYALKSPATFGEEPENKKEGYPYTGNAGKGKAIYELSCQTCHHPGGESALVLDDSKLTFKRFKNKLYKEHRFSIYEIVRHGTVAVPGHRPYMPHYTLERMSDKQVEDLVAYVLQQAG